METAPPFWSDAPPSYWVDEDVFTLLVLTEDDPHSFVVGGAAELQHSTIPFSKKDYIHQVDLDEYPTTFSYFDTKVVRVNSLEEFSLPAAVARGLRFGDRILPLQA